MEDVTLDGFVGCIDRTATCVAALAVGGLLVMCIVEVAGAQEARIGRQESEVTPTAEPIVSCSTSGCHSEMKQFAHVHQPAETDQCDVCHEPKEGATPLQSGVRHEFKRATDNPELCQQCHDSLVDEDYVHKPVLRELCVLCHDPHGSQRPLFLRVKQDQQLCSQCHRLTFLDRKYVHQPVKEGKCLECHDPHGGDFRRFLRGEFTPEPYEPFELRHYQLCYRCHEPEQVTERTTTSATNFRNGKVNLHFKHVNMEEKGRTCNLCHEVHASAKPKLIKETTSFGSWQLPLNFTPTATGGSCMPGCHRMRGYDRVEPVQNE